MEGRKRWQEQHEISYIINFACLINPWTWTSFVLQNLIIMNKQKRENKSQKILINFLFLKEEEELEKRVRRETRASESTISISLGREAGEWRLTSWKKYRTLENHCIMCETDHDIIGREDVQVLLRHELIYHLICFERLQYLNWSFNFLGYRLLQLEYDFLWIVFSRNFGIYIGYRRNKRPLQKARRDKRGEKWHLLGAILDAEMLSVRSTRFLLNQLGSPPSENPSWMRLSGLQDPESLLGNSVMVKLKSHPLQFSLFCYLLGVFILWNRGLHTYFSTISHFLKPWGQYTKKHIWFPGWWERVKDILCI